MTAAKALTTLGRSGGRVTETLVVELATVSLNGRAVTAVRSPTKGWPSPEDRRVPQDIRHGQGNRHRLCRQGRQGKEKPGSVAYGAVPKVLESLASRWSCHDPFSSSTPFHISGGGATQRRHRFLGKRRSQGCPDLGPPQNDRLVKGPGPPRPVGDRAADDAHIQTPARALPRPSPPPRPPLPPGRSLPGPRRAYHVNSSL